jgi:hypothetical protein
MLLARLGREYFALVSELMSCKFQVRLCHPLKLRGDDRETSRPVFNLSIQGQTQGEEFRDTGSVQSIQKTKQWHEAN